MAMTSRERAELAFKVMGIVWIAGACPYLGWPVRVLYGAVRGLWQGQGLSAFEGLGGDLMQPPGLFASRLLIGVALVAAARRVGAWLVTRGTDETAPIEVDALRITAVLLGLETVWVGAFTTALALDTPFSAATPWSLGFGALGLVLAALGPLLGRALGGLLVRRMRSIDERARLVGIGLAVLGLYVAVRQLARLAIGVGASAHFLAARMSGISHYGTALGRQFTEPAVGLGMGVAVLLAAVPLARRLARPRDAQGERPEPMRLSPSDWLGLSMVVAVAWLFTVALARLVGRPYLPWSAEDALSLLLRMVVVPILLAIAAFWLAGKFAWPLGAWLWGRRKRPVEDAPSTDALLVAEVGITVVLVVALVGALAQGIWLALALVFPPDIPAGAIGIPSISLDTALGAGLLALAARLALLFQADLAWMACRGPEGEGALTSERRVEALRPWIILYGAWLTISGTGRLLTWLIWDMPRGSWLSLPGPHALFGVVLILTAGWLSRRFTWGRLWPRLRGGRGRASDQSP